MTIETYLLYPAALGVFFATPPDTSQLLIIANSARHGLKKCGWTIAGDLTANALQMTAAAFGMACIGIVFLLARFVLLTNINRNRDAGQAGDPAAKKRFDALHRMSVIVNMVQLPAVPAVLVRYVAH